VPADSTAHALSQPKARAARDLAFKD